MTAPDYADAPPPPVLAGRVALFWRLRSDGSGDPECISPDGCCEIIIHRARPPLEQRGTGPAVRQPQRFLYGPMTRVLTIEPDGGLDFYAIRLEPWAVGLLGRNPADWRDRAVDLDDIAPDLSRGLGDLAACGPDIDAFAEQAGPLLEAAFTPFAAMADARAAIDRLESGEVESIAALSRKLDLTDRTLSRRLERAAGLSARTCLGISRFQRARAAIKAGAVSLSEVAAECGYADQAHMTREFRRFSGETPRLARRPATFDPVYG